MNKIEISALAAVAALAMTACGNHNRWTVEGTVAPGHGHDLVVEASDNGRWYPLDTIKVNDKGHFSYSHDAQGYPDVYRLRSDSMTVYFPVDSIETVKVTPRGDSYVISGSAQAEMMMQADSILDLRSPMAEKKNAIARLILADPASITAYYVINRKINGEPVFNPADRPDLRVIGAVANAFNASRPADPRTAYLTRLYLDSRRSIAPGKGVALEATEINAPEINLYDNTGVRRSLNEVASHGNVVILNFTSYMAEESPAFNVMLNSTYEKFRSRGLEIYQVALDDNEYEWKRVADNLPWVTVINDAHDSAQVLVKYNVGSIPAIFILDRNGEVVERVTDMAELDNLVAKYL